MRQVSEVLRLSAQGLSHREIAQSLGLSPTTVGNYLDRCRKAGIRWPLPEGLDAAGLEALLFQRSEEEVLPRGPMPEWLEVHRELKRHRHVTRQLLWVEHRQNHPEGLGYSQFCHHYHVWLGRQDLVMRFEHVAGDRTFVDFCGDTVPVVRRETGEIWKAQIFVGVLGASGYVFVKALESQELACWLGAHVEMLEFFGGSSRVWVPDNLKSGVTKACWYDPEINPSYLELARHHNAIVLPARPAHPRDKASVEAAVQVVERWVLAPLRNRKFFTLGELNAAIAEHVIAVNRRPFRGLQISRRDLFEDLDRPALQPLPPSRYELALWKSATVNIDYHIEFDHHYYSAPYQLVRERIEVRATRTVVELLHRNRRVASHVRSRRRGGFTTNPEHMPASHRAHLEWTPSRLINWAATVGAKVAEVVEHILTTRPHPEHGYRACLGLMRLEKRYERERVEAACARALAIGSPTYRSVEAILKNGLDQVPMSKARPQLAVIRHENLRGPEYYQKEA